MKKMKKFNVLLSSALLAFSLLFVGGVATSVEASAETVTETTTEATTSIVDLPITMEEGASVRYNEDTNGIRFRMLLSEEEYNALLDKKDVNSANYMYKSVRFGMLIYPVSYESEVGRPVSEETVFGPNNVYTDGKRNEPGKRKIVNVYNSKMEKYTNGNMSFNGVATNIPTELVTSEFQAQGYVRVEKVNADGSTTTEYKMVPSCKRSITYVSQRALFEGDEGLTDLLVNKFITPVAAGGELAQTATYTVEHYLQKADGTFELMPALTEEKTGYINDRIEIEPYVFEGYSCDASLSQWIGPIYANDMLTLKLMYVKSTEVLTFDENTENLLSWQEEFNLPGKAVGEAKLAVISKADVDNATTGAKIYDYTYFDSDAKRTAFESFTGNVFEVYSRPNTHDGGILRFATPYTFTASQYLEIKMFSPSWATATADDGWYIHIYREDDNALELHVNSTQNKTAEQLATYDYTYNIYEWTTLYIPLEKVKWAGNELANISKISFSYAGGTEHGYLYVNSIKIVDNIAYEANTKNLLPQSNPTNPADINNGYGPYEITANGVTGSATTPVNIIANTSLAAIQSYTYFNTEAKKNTFDEAKNSRLGLFEIVAARNSGDGGIMRFSSPYAYDTGDYLRFKMYSTANSTSSGDGWYVRLYDTNNDYYEFRLNSTLATNATSPYRYTIYDWSTICVPLSDAKVMNEGATKGNALQAISKIVFYHAGNATGDTNYKGYLYLDFDYFSILSYHSDVTTDFYNSATVSYENQTAFGSIKAPSRSSVAFKMISAETWEEAAITDYEFFNTQKIRGIDFKEFSGYAIEVVAKSGATGGVKLDLTGTVALPESGNLQITMYSPSWVTPASRGDGWYFLIYDSYGNMYQWRINSNLAERAEGVSGENKKVSTYNIYQWEGMNLSVTDLKNAGISNIDYIIFAYGGADNQDGYLYINSIQFTSTEDRLLPSNKGVVDYTFLTYADSEVEGYAQSDYTWIGSYDKGGSDYKVLEKADTQEAGITEYEWFKNSTDGRKANFEGYNGETRVWEIITRNNTMDGAKVTLKNAVAIPSNTKLSMSMFVANPASGYCIYIEDSNGTGYSWRINASDLNVTNWSELTLDVSVLIENDLTDIKSISVVSGNGTTGTGDYNYAYVTPISFVTNEGAAQ